MSIFKIVGSLLIGLGATISGIEVKNRDTIANSSGIESSIDEWYRETLAEDSTTKHESADQQLADAANGNGESKELDDSRDLGEKIEYLQKSLEVSPSQSQYDNVLERFATASNPNQDNVGKLQTALDQNDVNTDTIEEKLETVFDYARIAEFFINRSSEAGNVKRFNTDSIDTFRDDTDQVAETFNEFLTTIHNQNNTIQKLKRQVESKVDRINELKEERDEFEKDFNQLKDHVDQFLDKVDNYIIPSQRYRNMNRNGKLSHLPELIKQGNIKSQPLNQLVDHLQSEHDAQNYQLSGALIELLDAVSLGECKIQEFENLIEEINQTEKTTKQISNVDVNRVEKEADNLQNRAENLTGIVAEEIATELKTGKIRKIIDQKPDDELIYAIDKTLGHYEGILDAIEKNKSIDRSIKGLQEQIRNKRENYDHYHDNRPGYNHNIQEVIHERLQRELDKASEMASDGETEKAKGRLYMIEVGYDIIDTIYTDPKTLSVIEAN